MQTVCGFCNLTKADRIEVPDPVTRKNVALFHPRREVWESHFFWEGYRLVGRTACGRATVLALDLNHDRRIRIRRAEEFFDWFPP